MDLAVVALAFAAIFVVELPDKTFIATLVLSTKYRPLYVWIGVGLAFAVQTGIAVGLGTVVSFLPETAVKLAAAALFLLGAVLLLREAMSGEEAEEAFETRGDPHGLRVVLASFLVLFAAEWGDLSQLLTLSLVARYDDPLAVFVGAWAALLTVSGLAVVAGRLLLRHIPLRTLHFVGAGVCVVLAAVTVAELL